MIGAFIALGDRVDSPGYVIAENGCHLWVGALSHGYGNVRIGKRVARAHVVRYEAEVGPVPHGMELDHFTCNDKRCCNPAHVRPVTRRENTLRSESAAARNAAKEVCRRGHRLTAGNLVPYDLARGRRRCAECTRTKRTRR